MTNSLKTALRQALEAHAIKPDRIESVLAHADLWSISSLSKNGVPDPELIEAYAQRLAAQSGYTSPEGDGGASSGGAGGVAGLAEARRRFGNQSGWHPR